MTRGLSQDNQSLVVPPAPVIEWPRRPRPLRVAHVGFTADSEERDGERLLRVWPTLPAVATAVARAGIDVVVVQAAARRETIVRDGVVFHFVDEKRSILTGVRRLGQHAVLPHRLVAQVVSLRPDIIHIHGLQNPRAIRYLGRALPDVPMIVQDHATRAPRGWRRAVWRIVCRRLTSVAFTARGLATPFVTAGILDSDLPVFEVLEGSTYFTPGDRQVARDLTGLYGDPCLLWTGHFNANKDPLTTLAAFAQATTQLPDAHLWCCFGTAPLLQEVHDFIAADERLRDRVTLLGSHPHSEMEQYFRAADFFVQTSHFEGSGYSLIEALACGTPALVTDIPASRRITANGSVSSLTPVGDAPALAAAMVTWAQRDPIERRRAARAWFDEALTFDGIGRDLRAAYESLVPAQ
ncbi:MAG: glycosyltransferase family 4 protein [Gemmatimonadaceae bacterium]